ncbi:MAG: hypothetical protein ACK41C_02495 [Phenylobacterium sp.]|uniref:hypothetical protein n=1 Tax=Phenylobacterium sp. TaxID=1871053 RepID=UPI00391C6E0A
MSDLEKLEAEYRRLATKVIYAGFEGGADPADVARLEQLSEELLRRSTIGSFAREKPEPVAA